MNIGKVMTAGTVVIRKVMAAGAIVIKLVLVGV